MDQETFYIINARLKRRCLSLDVRTVRKSLMVLKINEKIWAVKMHLLHQSLIQKNANRRNKWCILNTTSVSSWTERCVQIGMPAKIDFKGLTKINFETSKIIGEITTKDWKTTKNSKLSKGLKTTSKSITVSSTTCLNRLKLRAMLTNVTAFGLSMEKRKWIPWTCASDSDGRVSNARLLARTEIDLEMIFKSLDVMMSNQITSQLKTTIAKDFRWTRNLINLSPTWTANNSDSKARNAKCIIKFSKS